MGYRLNRLGDPLFMAGSSKPMRTEFGIHLRLESCDQVLLLICLFNRPHNDSLVPEIQEILI